ncbi:MAG TPA: hypothetical protein VI455_05045 [Terriglobia bacterium]
MRTFRFWLAALVLTGLALASGAMVGRGATSPTTVKGYVIDSACTFTKHLKKPISPDCAIACAKAGSDLAIQTEDGIIYWPISAETPAAGQNDKLVGYAGKMVSVTGTVYTKGGSRAIVIEKVEAADSSK